MMKENKNKISSLIDNMVSSLKINEELDKKLVKRLKLMPYLKEEYEFVAINENSKEAEYFCDGFVLGAEWRINSIWHDVSEPPKKNNVYLSIFDGRKIKTVFWSDICKWEEFMKIYEFNGWCYLDYLLPNTED